MRKILILNGAGKRNGNTAALIKSFREGAKQHQTNTHVIVGTYNPD
jgi:multimeric flavodoxin WrbA